MAGKLYGVGVGPGDPGLLTLKAVQVIKACDVIAVPGKEPENTVAYQIASGACPAIRKKEILGIHMPMTKDKDRLKKSHADGARILEAYLDQGKAVAFLTLGDPTVYSTYIYLHNIVKEAGYETEIVSGVTSFCAAAARLEMDIASKAQQIHIIPASYQIEEALLYAAVCKRRRRAIMIHFVGAGPGAEDLITVRGQRLLREADVIIYAGSLVNPGLLKEAGEACRIYNSAVMTLEEVIAVMKQAEAEGLKTVRLHTGDPCLYGAIREQMDILDQLGISYESCPGVSSFCAAAAALNLEYTLPEVSQSVVITRMEGRTPVPEKERIASFASHGATMVLFLSTGLLKELTDQLIAGGYRLDTPAAIVFKASWPEEETHICTVGTLEETAKKYGITKTALIIVGEVVLHQDYERSRLYDPSFTTEYRKAGHPWNQQEAGDGKD